MEGRGRSRGLVALLALEAASQYYRMQRKPPVTAALIAANTLVYLRPSFLDPILPSIDQVWFNPHLILKHKDLKRFLLSPFYHIGEPHLFYNMLSLLWKGIQLENSMSSSAEFASTIAALLVGSQGISLVLAKSLLVFFGREKQYYDEYSAGFSGVLFAMKVVLDSRSSSGAHTSVYGVLVPTRFAAWAELVLIQLFVPRVSFLGHLAGILAGLLFLRLRRSVSSPWGAIAAWPWRFARRRFFGRGRVGSRESRVSSWRCRECTYDNHELLGVCEMCGTSRSGDDFDSSPPTVIMGNDEPSVEELRRRRVQRFGSYKNG